MTTSAALDLAVKFGNQTRFKCAVCTHYMRVDDEEATCRCGARYIRLPGGRFRRVSDDGRVDR